MESLNPTRVLFVCTANQCRSPLAEAIATRVGASHPIEFSSGGLIRGGVAMPRIGVRVAAAKGLDLSMHLSRQIGASDLAEADVVLTMTRAHSREVVARDPDTWPRVFTVKQFARWLSDRELPDQRLRRWLDFEAGDRPRSELFGADRADDIIDPVNSSARVWRQVAFELEDRIEMIVLTLMVNSSTR
jgi:protein-tyrosine phosphatase